MAPLSAAAAASVLAELPSLIKRETFGERLAPSDEQRITLGVLAGYFVFICIAWNVWGLKHLLMPFKIWVVTTHEWCHAVSWLGLAWACKCDISNSRAPNDTRQQVCALVREFSVLRWSPTKVALHT